MKRIWILLTLVLHGMYSYAQFNTVSMSSRTKQIVTEPETSSEASFSADIKPSDERGVCDFDDSFKNIREQLIEQYISVSYPLSQLTVNSDFGVRRDPFSGKRRQHNGIDLRARKDEVYSMLHGKVLKVGSDKRAGNYVTMQYGDYTVSYCHLTKAVVQRGDLVNAGEVIGVSGNTGRSTNEHLHLTCKYKGKYINPSILLDYVKETRQECLEKLKSLV